MARVTMRYKTALEAVRERTGQEVVVDYVDARRMQPTGAYLSPLKRQLKSLLPGRGNGHNGDVYHSIEHSLGIRGTTVTTFHDLWDYGVYNLPNLSQRIEGMISCYLSRRVVCLTPSVRDDVVRFFGRPAANRARVVPLPFPDPGHHREDPVHDLIWFGNTGPRKNLIGFVRALQTIQRPLRVMLRCQKHPRHPEDLAAQAVQIWSRHYVKPWHTVQASSDYVSEADLDRLYRSSRAIVCTSLSEGFPATLYEAYSRGTHIISVPLPSIMDALPPWLPGVHYARSVAVDDLADILAKAPDMEPFTPDPGFIRRHSFESIGWELTKVYDDAEAG